jgi:hypothetical protein
MEVSEGHFNLGRQLFQVAGGEEQGTSEELAVLAGAGSRRWVWLDLDATTGQGNSGEQGGTGGVIGAIQRRWGRRAWRCWSQFAKAVIWVTVS